MDHRETGASGSGSSQRSLANDDERMEGYLQRPSRDVPVQAVSQVESSRSGHEHRDVPARDSGDEVIFEAIPITRALHRLEDGRVCDEPEISLTPEEIKRFREVWDILSDLPLRGLRPGELASAPRDNFIAVHDNMFRNGFSVPLP